MNPLEYAETIAYSSKETLRFTYEMACKFHRQPGVFVETGCAAGAQIIAMLFGAPGKKVYAFDSFQGLPLPSNRDNQMPGIMMLSQTEQAMLPDPGKQELVTTGAVAVSLDDFKMHVEASGVQTHSLFVKAGWFELSIPIIASEIEPIAILRLDGDLYNSTWVCLQHLFPKVIKGGCVIVDDWNLPGCQAACNEYFELIDYQPDYKFISDIAYFYK